MSRHDKPANGSSSAADASLASAVKNMDGQTWRVSVPHLYGEEVQVATTGEYAFPGPLRNRLVAAILRGEKTATASLLEEYQRGGEPLPKLGDVEVVIDSAGEPVCLTEVTEVVCSPFVKVTDEHAVAEGEGYTNAEEWRVAHREFWTSREFIADMGEPEILIDGNIMVVLVSMEVIAKL